MPQHNDTHAIPESWFPGLIDRETKGPVLRENSDEVSDRAAVARDTFKGTWHFLTRRMYLWLGCLACNAAFSLIGTRPRQFIIFNLLIALAFSASAIQGRSFVATENYSSRRAANPPALGCRPLIRYLMDLLVACYATTVFIDNLATGSTLLGSLH